MPVPPRVSDLQRPTITCGRCRLRRTDGEWSALPAVLEVAGEELARVVTHLPPHTAVVVRACTCGAPIARLAPVAPADSGIPRA